jgi:hypothetical protein
MTMMNAKELILNGHGNVVWDAVATAILQAMSPEQQEMYAKKYPKASKLLKAAALSGSQPR